MYNKFILHLEVYTNPMMKGVRRQTTHYCQSHSAEKPWFINDQTNVAVWGRRKHEEKDLYSEGQQELSNVGSINFPHMSCKHQLFWAYVLGKCSLFILDVTLVESMLDCCYFRINDFMTWSLSKNLNWRVITSCLTMVKVSVDWVSPNPVNFVIFVMLWYI